MSCIFSPAIKWLGYRRIKEINWHSISISVEIFDMDVVSILESEDISEDESILLNSKRKGLLLLPYCICVSCYFRTVSVWVATSLLYLCELLLPYSICVSCYFLTVSVWVATSLLYLRELLLPYCICVSCYFLTVSVWVATSLQYLCELLLAYCICVSCYFRTVSVWVATSLLYLCELLLPYCICVSFYWFYCLVFIFLTQIFAVFSPINFSISKQTRTKKATFYAL